MLTSGRDGLELAGNDEGRSEADVSGIQAIEGLEELGGGPLRYH